MCQQIFSIFSHLLTRSTILKNKSFCTQVLAGAIEISMDSSRL